ncbi:MAG: protein translocase subunit SecF [Chloroflexota bacterium]
MFDIIGKRRWFFIFSLIITVPGLLFILATPINNDVGLRFSIDYTGGTRWTIRFEDPKVTADAVRAELVGLGQPEATVVTTGRGFLDIKLSKLDLRSIEPTPAPSVAPTGGPEASASTGASASPGGSASPGASPSPDASSAEPSPSASASPVPGGNGQIPTEGEIGAIATALQARFGPIAEQSSLSSIGAVVSSDLVGQAILLILIGSLGILAWITVRFRDVKMGVTALIALVHDVVVVLGVFAILGTFIGLEIDALFVTAMLTVIGFSVHDTIVVFDRIRENRVRHVGEPFAEIVNHSILQTLGRSITTSFTVVLTLFALLLFGGSATSEFVFALLIGIVSGTYSSIFNASPLLVVWTEWDQRRKARQAPVAVRRPSAS